MITSNPWQLGKGRRPGTEPERRFKAPPTGQIDPPEFVEACQNCPLSKCMGKSSACPLRGIKLERRTKAGKPDGRSRKRGKKEPDETDREIIRMWKNGGRVSWIARELGLSGPTVSQRLKRLERDGAL